jgi:hypothetical protein
MYLVYIEHLEKDFKNAEEEDFKKEVILCDHKQYVNLITHIDDTLYSIFAVDIIEIDSYNNIYSYVKKNPNIEHG